MKQIPFLAFPLGEQDAVFQALRNAGVPVRTVCVSRHEVPDLPALQDCSFTTVTTPNWCRTYDCRTESNWIAALEHEIVFGAIPV
jgi:hypothetical protein